MRTTLFAVCLLWSCGAFAEQTCDTSVHPLSAPSERFADNGDGTVTDTESRLMWMRCSLGQNWSGGTCTGAPRQYSWEDASAAAEMLNQSGSQFFNDWRVPKLPELASIAERECQNPRINLTIFPNTPPARFWTTTLRPGGEFDAYAYALDFGSQGVQHESKALSFNVRLVRTGQ